MKVKIQTRIRNEKQLVESESENLDSEAEINKNCGGKAHYSQVLVTLWIQNEAESINTLQLHMICRIKNYWASRNSLSFRCRCKKIMWHFKSVEIFCSRRRSHAKNRKGRKWTFHSTLDNKQYSCPLFLKSIIGLKTFMELFKINIKREDIQNGSWDESWCTCSLTKKEISRTQQESKWILCRVFLMWT